MFLYLFGTKNNTKNVMKIGKPDRSFIVRIVDLKSNRSKNISIYGEGKLEKIHKAILKALEDEEDDE